MESFKKETDEHSEDAMESVDATSFHAGQDPEEEDIFGLKSTDFSGSPEKSASVENKTSEPPVQQLEKPEQPLREAATRPAVSEDEFVANALIKKAQLLYKLQRFEEALPAFADIYDRFASSNNEKRYDQASEALLKQLEAMEQLDMEEKAYPVYSKIIERLGNSDKPRYAKQVDKSFLKLSEKMLQEGDKSKALGVIEKMITRFKNQEPESEYLEKAMYTHAELLEDLGDDEKALEAYDAFLSRYGK